MIFIQHRVNTLDAVRSLAAGLGAEIDIRSDYRNVGRLIVTHDPWGTSCGLEDWLLIFASQKRGPLILNTKEDGLEELLLKLMQKYAIEDFFFLDTTLPTLVKWTMNEGRRCFAVRASSYEPIEIVKKFSHRAEWIWLDCFDGRPVDVQFAKELKKDFKVCLVSPELQGHAQAIAQFKPLLSFVNAICTKLPEKWGI